MSEQSKVDEYDLLMEHVIFPIVLAILPYDSDEKVPKNTSILIGEMYLAELSPESSPESIAPVGLGNGGLSSNSEMPPSSSSPSPAAAR